MNCKITNSTIVEPNGEASQYDGICRCNALNVNQCPRETGEGGTATFSGPFNREVIAYD